MVIFYVLFFLIYNFKRQKLVISILPLSTIFSIGIWKFSDSVFCFLLFSSLLFILLNIIFTKEYLYRIRDFVYKLFWSS